MRQMAHRLSPASVYPWLVLVTLLDVFLTSRILAMGGSELNALADHVLTHAGVPGMLAFKLLAIGVVMAICEFIARRDDPRGRRLAEWGVALNVIPVALGGAQIVAAGVLV